MNHIEKFKVLVKENALNNELVKIIISNKRDKGSDLKAVYVKLVVIKNSLKYNFVFKHNTKDLTKNYSEPEALDIITKLLKNDFFQAVVFTHTNDWNLIIRKDESSTFKKSKATIVKKVGLEHNKLKQRLIETNDNIYLKELGVLNNSGHINPKKQKKFRQINKYIEVIENVIKPIKFSGKIKIVDMGAGKGYLTFALYDYLKNIAKLNPNVIGVELRKELVEKCNLISQKSNFKDLKFIEGSIQKIDIPDVDVLIALHACDTATDDAIYKGIKSEAKVIVCAPCCHKQIRKQINPQDELKLITQFGILKERQSELLTDALRALLLEANGYKTKVFEFISTEHTPKNVLIVATKTRDLKEQDAEKLKQIESIKKTHGIDFHYLEKLLAEDPKYVIH